MYVLPALRNDDVQGAVPETQFLVQGQDLGVLAAVFADHVQAGDPEVDAAIAHADYNVPRSLEEHLKSGHGRDGSFELARVGFMHPQAGLGQKAETVLGQAALTGKCETYVFAVSDHILSKKNPSRVREGIKHFRTSAAGCLRRS